MSPLLSSFLGISIRINNEVNGQHNTPHLHAYYQDYQVAMDFEGEVLAGEFPKNKLKLLVAWVELHKTELKANWWSWNTEGEYFKIKPLE